MKTVCTINIVKLKSSTVLISQLSIMLYNISQSLLDTRRNLMDFYLSQAKKSPWQTSSARNSKTQEFCFVPQLNIFAVWTISESHIPNFSALFWKCLAPRNLKVLLDYWPQLLCFEVCCVQNPGLIPVTFSVQAVRALALCNHVSWSMI